MIDFYKRSLKLKKLTKLDDFQKECWINVTSPSKEELKYLTDKFNLDEQNLISGTDKHEVSRVETDEGTIYVFLKVISNNNDELETLLMIQTKTFILTLSNIIPEFINKIIENKIEFITTQKQKCFLTLFSLNNKYFEKTTLRIVKAVKAERNMTEITDKQISALLGQEDILNYFVLAYNQTNLIYSRLMKQMKFFEEDLELLNDLKIEAEQGYELCKLSLKTISNIRTHSDIMISHKLNKVITTLTIFTILISVPAAISGIYGMNILLPFQHNQYAVYYILGIIILFWIVFIMIMKKKKIL